MANSNPLVSVVKSKLTVAQMEQLVQFTDAGTFLTTLDQCNWTGATEIEEILTIARQNINLGAKLSAIKYLREILKDTMESSGLLVRATKTMHNPNGDTLSFTADLVTAALPPARKGVLNNDSPAEQKEVGETPGCDDGPVESDPDEGVVQEGTDEEGEDNHRSKGESDGGGVPGAGTLGTHRPPIADCRRLFPGLATSDDSPTGDGG